MCLSSKSFYVCIFGHCILFDYVKLLISIKINASTLYINLKVPYMITSLVKCVDIPNPLITIKCMMHGKTTL